MNEVSVSNANDPMPTGVGEIGTLILCPFEDGHYNDTVDKGKLGHYYCALSRMDSIVTHRTRENWDISTMPF